MAALKVTHHICRILYPPFFYFSEKCFRSLYNGSITCLWKTDAYSRVPNNWAGGNSRGGDGKFLEGK